MVGSNPASLLIGSPRPLSSLRVEFDRRAPARLEIGGAILRPNLLRPNGSISFDLPLTRPRAVHPMWWTRDDYYLYGLDFRLPGAPVVPIGFAVYPGAEP